MSVMAATFALLAAAHADDRVMPPALAEGAYAETSRAREDYKQAPDELKKWNSTHALPVNWSDTGLRADAKLVFTEEVMDGGSRAFCFKDSVGRYFVFCLSAPLMNDGSGKVARSDPVFYVGVFHSGEPGAIKVPVDSETEKFLIGILREVVARRPPKALPPHGDGWDAMSHTSLSETRQLTPEQRTALRLGLGSFYVLQAVTPDALKKLSTDDLITLLSKAPNPLKQGEASVVVLMLPLNQTDDVMRVDGYEPPGKFFVSHLTRAKEKNWETPEWMIFYLPIAGITKNSAGFSYAINSPEYLTPEAKEGYRLESAMGSGTGRMFK